MVDFSNTNHLIDKSTTRQGCFNKVQHFTTLNCTIYNASPAVFVLCIVHNLCALPVTYEWLPTVSSSWFGNIILNGYNGLFITSSFG